MIYALELKFPTIIFEADKSHLNKINLQATLLFYENFNCLNHPFTVNLDHVSITNQIDCSTISIHFFL